MAQKRCHLLLWLLQWARLQPARCKDGEATHCQGLSEVAAAEAGEDQRLQEMQREAAGIGRQAVDQTQSDCTQG
jgi:hypothetical protein